MWRSSMFLKVNLMKVTSFNPRDRQVESHAVSLQCDNANTFQNLIDVPKPVRTKSGKDVISADEKSPPAAMR